MDSTSNFLYPRHRYYGQFSSGALIFNANLQEFAQRVSYIASLQTGGKISPQEAYYQIESLWETLRSSLDNSSLS